MPAILRSATELGVLTRTQKSVAGMIAAGLSNQQAAAALGIKAGTLNQHVMSIGYRFGVTSRPAKVHAALASGQAPAPEAPHTAPDFTAEELLLLHALATHSENEEIAAAAHLALALVTSRIRDLVEKAGALNPSHLVGLAHTWQLLGTDTATQPGAPPPTRSDRPATGGTL
ncbi:helix-turn-helix transcriptional regulator [Streptomyces kaniharaensis]|uniref:Helix-turn-helix transcriptional regulator n=1 Tax=Streptomyces kaniharaensis TaxID=212423 RepID=A0A6N7L012_9ACTN|nr:LuxR C-terminal-related transcriptional regulator [Streptomyces kaniharaensis]MQS17336.1 helix-turn-helix transcriptional regulator [Streptomyces kaniharaensis]